MQLENQNFHENKPFRNGFTLKFSFIFFKPSIQPRVTRKRWKTIRPPRLRRVRTTPYVDAVAVHPVYTPWSRARDAAGATHTVASLGLSVVARFVFGVSAADIFLTITPAARTAASRRRRRRWRRPEGFTTESPGGACIRACTLACRCRVVSRTYMYLYIYIYCKRAFVYLKNPKEQCADRSPSPTPPGCRHRRPLRSWMWIYNMTAVDICVRVFAKLQY